FSASFITAVAEAGLSNETVFGTAVFYPPDVIANRPAASATIVGAMYYGTDTGQLYRSDGASTWTAIAFSPVKQVQTLTDAATVTPNSAFDGGILTSLSQTTTIAAPSGSPTQFRDYVLRIKSSSSQTLSWNAIYRASPGIPLGTATSGGSQTDYW